jgi:hypothetical protein
LPTPVEENSAKSYDLFIAVTLVTRSLFDDNNEETKEANVLAKF